MRDGPLGRLLGLADGYTLYLRVVIKDLIEQHSIKQEDQVCYPLSSSYANLRGSPRNPHMCGARRVLCFLARTRSRRLCVRRNGSLDLVRLDSVCEASLLLVNGAGVIICVLKDFTRRTRCLNVEFCELSLSDRTGYCLCAANRVGRWVHEEPGL